MPKFAFDKIKTLPGTKFKILQLNIDGVKQLDEFERNMEEELKPQYRSLLSFMDRYTNVGKMPGRKLVDITPKGEKIKEFEFRTKNGIRLYAIQIETGKLIIVCGYKGTQKNDINRLRQIKNTLFPKK